MINFCENVESKKAIETGIYGKSNCFLS